MTNNSKRVRKSVTIGDSPGTANELIFLEIFNHYPIFYIKNGLSLKTNYYSQTRTQWSKQQK